MKVDVGSDCVAILEDDGKVLLFWTFGELLEDPSRAFPMASAICLACVDPVCLREAVCQALAEARVAAPGTRLDVFWRHVEQRLG